MPEKSGDPKRPYNTSLLVDPTGAIAGAYRKIHLFDVDLPDGTSLKESNGSSPGDSPSITRLRDDDLKLGKIIKLAGYRQDLVSGDDLIVVHWYGSLRELIGGLEPARSLVLGAIA